VSKPSRPRIHNRPPPNDAGRLIHSDEGKLGNCPKCPTPESPTVIFFPSENTMCPGLGTDENPRKFRSTLKITGTHRGQPDQSASGWSSACISASDFRGRNNLELLMRTAKKPGRGRGFPFVRAGRKAEGVFLNLKEF